MKQVLDHHTIINKPHNIQIRLENRTKPVGHYTAPRRKITKVGGNLPLVVQFRVLCRLSLLTAQHSFLFLFLFPIFLPFLLLFSSFLFFSFPPFSPFLSSLSLLLSSLSLFPSPSFSLLLSRTEACCPLVCMNSPCEAPYIGFKGAMHVDTWHAMCHTCMPLPCIVTHGLPCVTHMDCHVSPTWFSMCHPHGSPCIAQHLLPRNT